MVIGWSSDLSKRSKARHNVGLEIYSCFAYSEKVVSDSIPVSKNFKQSLQLYAICTVLMASLFDASAEKTNGTRLARLLIDGGTHVLREYLHSLYPPETLPTVLNNNKIRLQALKTRGKIFDGQWEILFPSSGEPPDTSTFDITLLHFLLREICFLTEPFTGWHNIPTENDITPEAHIVRIKCFRNELCHSISTGIPDDVFEDKWAKISRSLVALGLDQSEIDLLKNEPVDHDTKRRVEEEVMKCDWEPRVSNAEKKIEQLEGQLSSLNIQGSHTSELSSCLPDEVEEVLGRSTEIQRTTQAIQRGAFAVVVITGAPGFGKTTVANKVAHELAKPQHCRTVLYCYLRSKATLNDVATSMILACSTNQSQPPDNPQHWLLNWSKQQMKNVTFVLDYADDALELQESRTEFISMMQDMRTLSKQKITFVITSRRTFKADRSHLKIENIRLLSLWPEDAEKLLLSKVHSDKTRQGLSRTERIVELCACVTLALCIVGSLLSDYKEDKLISSLEKEPLEVLQDDEMSLRNTIETSFDLLKPKEQQALAILSMFPGSFESDAAETVIAAKTDSSGPQPMVILRSLINRSLLEQPCSGRYQVHQLIQVFAKKIGRAKWPHVFVDLEKVASGHFVSRLSENAEKYWSKDKCKESIEAFNEDRHNFEYFLRIYVQTVEEKPHLDPLLESCTKRFLDQLPQKCMYLEMCLLPSFYVMVLEKLLTHFIAGNQAVHAVELLCLLGHEKRKVGERVKYKDLMKKAKQFYARKYREFRTNGLSQVLFFNSYARFLFEKSEKLKQMSEKAYEIALVLCNKKLSDHPEKAATLLLIGKRRRSIKALQEATILFSQCLGEHFMTAQGHKAIADFYFAKGNTDQLDKSFSYYKKALAMMKECGMGGHKETTMSLKNYAMCHKIKGNFHEAFSYLEEAKRIADIELDDDHRWKVMIDTQLALLLEDFGRVQEAIAMMKDALGMNLRLKQSIDQLGNKREIKRFLNRHRVTFSQDFPKSP